MKGPTPLLTGWRITGSLSMAFVLTWVCCAVWNSVKPLPPGTHVASLPVRLGESQLDFIDGRAHPDGILDREIEVLAHAEQIVVLDQSPVPPRLVQQMLARKRQRHNLKIVVITDPRIETLGGTPASALAALERMGIIVARARLERLRDPDPLYSSLWRLTLSWWSSPFDEAPAPGRVSPIATLRARNRKADQRQLLAADDGVGGWTSLVMSAIPTAPEIAAGVSVEIRGQLARAVVTSELQIATWSTEDDRLPVAPRVDGRGVGTIDARFLTEGALDAALRDAIGAANRGDSIMIAVTEFGERRLVDALAGAAARGAAVQLLLDTGLDENRAAAGELHRAGGNVRIRWLSPGYRMTSGFTVVQHRGDAWLSVGSANFANSGLGDLNLQAGIELRMPGHGATARAAVELFMRAWADAADYSRNADESRETYWRYRFATATGLAGF